MTVRNLLGFAVLAGLGVIGYEIFTGRIGSSVAPPAGYGVDSVSAGNTDGFLGLLARIESGGQPYVKNPNSSASGLYQFTKATAQALGLPWGNDPTKPFGGATPSVAQQDAAAKTLTDQNASILTKFGVALNNAALYAAHFLGPSAAVKVLTAPATAALQPLIGTNAMRVNGFPLTWTVGNFTDWLHSKTRS